MCDVGRDYAKGLKLGKGGGAGIWCFVTGVYWATAVCVQTAEEGIWALELCLGLSNVFSQYRFLKTQTLIVLNLREAGLSHTLSRIVPGFSAR